MDGLNIKQLDKMLQSAFDEAANLYSKRGFQRRIGFGKKPALVSVDLYNAWTRPGNPFTCDQGNTDAEIVPAMQSLLKLFRSKKLPVVHVTTTHEITDTSSDFNEMGLCIEKFLSKL